MDGISRKADLLAPGVWPPPGCFGRFRQPTCWSARRILKTGPTRGPSHVTEHTRYNPQSVSRDQLKSVGAPADRTALSALRRLEPDLEADVEISQEQQHRLLYRSQRGAGRAPRQFADLDAAGRMRGSLDAWRAELTA